MIEFATRYLKTVQKLFIHSSDVILIFYLIFYYSNVYNYEHLRMILLLFVCLLSACSSPELPKPLSINPQNPHYFLFRGKPAVLIGSTEHYGAVMNLDFDYVTYLNEIAASGLNVTRTFSGAYVEPGGAFGIKKNTLAPAPEKFICPWLRSTEPGYANGGNKFDLSEWDEAYFSRLKGFCD